jgi:glycosyltransferase involved in cell wall biosynthesis
MGVMYRAARWCWHLLPAPTRYRLYGVLVQIREGKQRGKQKGKQKAAQLGRQISELGNKSIQISISVPPMPSLPSLPAYTRFKLTLPPEIEELTEGGKRFSLRVLRSLYRRTLALIHRATLRNYYHQAQSYFPHIGRWDLIATTWVLFILRFHSFFLARAWGNAHHLRRLLPRRAVTGSPLRVMHVTSSFDIGGTQRQIKNLCIGASTRFEHATTEIFPEMNFLYRQFVTPEPERYIRGGLFQRALGHCVMYMGTRSPQLIQAYKLYRDFTAYRPDVVVGWGHEMSATTFLAATFARVPRIVFCIRTFNPVYGWVGPEMGSLLKVAHRRMTACVSAVITNSTPLREDHARWLGIGPGRIDVCPNGIDSSPLTPAEILERRRRVRKELGIEDDVFVAINVGRFSKEKGQMSIVQVNERIAPDYPGQLVWLLCGDGPTLEPVRARAASTGTTNIRFLGRTTAVYDYLCASDCFVMPSDFEGMPNAMMEAMACGLPCASTNRSGALDVARHDQEALFYEPGDLRLMEQHIRRFLDDRPAARAMGARAQARLQEFSAERFVTLFEEIVERAALGRNNRQAAEPAFGGARNL